MAVPLRVYTRTGGLISQIGEERRIPVTFEQIPTLVRQAVLAAEDDRFFEHQRPRLDGRHARAGDQRRLRRRPGQGGSTITQQAARNMFLTLDKTLRRKLSEIFVTFRMEKDFTKEQILATYLNVIFFGQRSYGIAAAAETFYGKRLDELSVGEAATLAGIIQLPSRYNPISNPKAAESARSYVLRPHDASWATSMQAQAAAASKEPVASRGFAPLVDVEAPYVAELVRQDVVQEFGAGGGERGPTRCSPPSMVGCRRRPTGALRIGLIEYDRRHGYRGALGKVTVPAGATARCARQAAGALSFREPAAVRGGAQSR